ncbi:MAG: hypothetical protein FRX48_02682 [Lasallia pustulata]|uniref:DUF676 domain-containing protein n=1 Tax=Lasallia pustulata TaxID=136370 RepID=A0A5M8PZ20_9LECA|nr:MAG: hypothetical protein FRX48_02682 [Lasallia pustulata]
MSHWLFRRSQEAAECDPEQNNTSYSTKGDYGLAVLNEPEDGAEVVADIVFIHGLTGNRETTWTNLKPKIFWPRDLLPSTLPKARIITYGYDADVIGFMSVSMNRIGHHAQDLVSKLADLRDTTNTSERPILFVAHSLGGLFCEDTLLLSKNSHESHLQRIVECTRGIAFMGTPHCGADKAKWGSVLAHLTYAIKTTNTSIVDILKPDSEVLARIQQEFAAMLQVRRDKGLPKMEITCFFENCAKAFSNLARKYAEKYTRRPRQHDQVRRAARRWLQVCFHCSVEMGKAAGRASSSCNAWEECCCCSGNTASWASPTSGGIYTQGGSTYSGQVNVGGGGHVHQGNVMNTR